MSSSSFGRKASSHLLRGQACSNCRRRKIRCDGARPICGQCSRATKPQGPCDYQEPVRSKNQVLEDTVSELEGRIQQLEQMGDAEAGPSATPEIRIQSPPASMSDASERFGSRSTHMTIASQGQLEVPSAPQSQILLDTFLNHATEFGFFLDPERFKRAALQPLPLGDPSRPTPALLSAVYLIGQAISRHDGGSEQETTYLTSTLQLISTATLGDHPLRIMHRLQAGVLLANYFFRNGRLLEARHHASSVCTLAVACGLHRVELITSIESAPAHLGEDIVQPVLEPASDSTELGERISAFWTVFTLHNFWSAALGAPISFAFDVALPVNVPWSIIADNPEPLENVQGRNMVHNLLVNGEDGGPSGLTLPALLSKAALLYQRSTVIAFDYLSGSQTNPSEMTAEIHTLDLLAENIRAHLPTPGQIRSTNFSLSRLVVVAHALANATVIKLHSLFMQPNAWSRQRCLTAAEILIHFSNDPIILELRVINPIMASLWPLACQVILDEITRLRTARELSLLPDVSEREVQLGRIIETAISVMGAFAQDSPYMGMELTKVQIAYASIAP